jgi:hypothetical protein
VALGTIGDAAWATRASATVEAVDAAKSTVSVWSADPFVNGAMTFEVHDTGAYDVGDRVGVILTGEDHQPSGLDREPILPQLVPIAGAFGVLTLVVIAIGTFFVTWRAVRRRRALRGPWRRVPLGLSSEGDQRYASLEDGSWCTTWRIIDGPVDLPRRGTVDAQVAGSGRRLAIRVFGSPQLATGKRCRAGSG